MIREESIQIPFKYAAGTAGSRFLVALRDDERILGSRCPACERVWCPLRAFCPQCGEEHVTDIEVGPEGVLVSWTEVVGSGAFALVRLDGADTALLHRWPKDAANVRVGVRVRARFATDRIGSILDLVGFEPVEGEAR